MERKENATNNDLSRWYRYAARQPGFVGHALTLIRDRIGQTLEAQRDEFGADEQAFLRLQAMPLPRANFLVVDANRIAEECGLSLPLGFVRAMIIGQNLERASSHEQGGSHEYYQAAFDEEQDLDEFPEEA